MAPPTIGTVLQLSNVVAGMGTPISMQYVHLTSLVWCPIFDFIYLAKIDIDNVRDFSHNCRGASSMVDATLYKDTYTFWVAKAAEVASGTGSDATFVPQHISKRIVEVAAKNGGSLLGLEDKTQQCECKLTPSVRTFVL